MDSPIQINKTSIESIDKIVGTLGLLAQRYPMKKLTPEIASTIARQDDSLVMWQWRAGIEDESRMQVETIVGGAMRVGGRGDGSIIMICDSELARGYEFFSCGDGFPDEARGDGVFYWYPWRRWANDWRAASIGDEFVYRNKRYRRVSVESFRQQFVGKVFNIAS